MADPVNTGFDTLFGGPLAEFRAALAAQGIQTSIFSGVRDNQKQSDLYDNFLAGRAGRPLPHPRLGPVPLAAAPGTSLHERGLAADIRPSNPADLPKMYALARQFGLQALGPTDPYHFQLANWRQAEATQPPNMAWDQTNPANVPSAYASNVDSSSAPAAAAINAQATPGMNINSVPPDALARMVGTLESGGGRYSSAQPKGMADPFYGQYPGFAKTYGQGPAGISNYANAVLAANPKASVGDFYAGYFSGTGQPGSPNFNNFNLLRQGGIQGTPGTPSAQIAASANFIKNAGVDPSTPLASMAGGGVGPGPGNVGPVTGFLPGAPTGQGGIGGDVAATGNLAQDVANAAPSPAKSAGGLLAGLGKSLSKMGDDQKKANSGGGGGQQQAQQLQAQQAAAPLEQAQQQRLMAGSAPMVAAMLANARKPLTWTSAPPGSMMGAGMGQQTPKVDPQAQIMAYLQQIPGTTLNSVGDGSYG